MLGIILETSYDGTTADARSAISPSPPPTITRSGSGSIPAHVALTYRCFLMCLFNISLRTLRGNAAITHTIQGLSSAPTEISKEKICSSPFAKSHLPTSCNRGEPLNVNYGHFVKFD